MPKTRSNKKRTRLSIKHSRRQHFKGGRGNCKHTRKPTRGGAAVTQSKFQHLTCSPLSEEYKHGNPTSTHDKCLPNNEIKVIKDYWNNANPFKRITATNPDQIWKEIRTHLSGTCKDDLCILNQPFMKMAKHKSSLHQRSGGAEYDPKDYYAPKMPKEWKKNPTEWLSNIEILEKMKQYEEAYPCFEFLGPTPIDFDKVLSDKHCVEKELCSFNLRDYISHGTKKIGIIFNTDPHDKGGSHWISLFINVPKKMIFFFDSAGDEAPPEVITFVKRVQQQGLALSPPIQFKFDQNYPNEHQYSTTECGMYSLYFIINMLEDKLTTKYLKTHIIPDQQMIDYRKKYFNSTDA
jgi:hypothetical protein